jgi:hypothetical protein
LQIQLKRQLPAPKCKENGQKNRQKKRKINNSQTNSGPFFGGEMVWPIPSTIIHPMRRKWDYGSIPTNPGLGKLPSLMAYCMMFTVVTLTSSSDPYRHDKEIYIYKYVLSGLKSHGLFWYVLIVGWIGLVKLIVFGGLSDRCNE